MFSMWVGVISPANSVEVVESTLLRIAEDVIGRNDEAISLELRHMGDAIVGRVMVEIGMIEFDQLVEPCFGVYIVFGKSEDLIRSGACRSRPFRWLVLNRGV